MTAPIDVDVFKSANNLMEYDYTWLMCNYCKCVLQEPIFLHADEKHYCQKCSATKGGGLRIKVLEMLLSNCQYQCSNFPCSFWFTPKDLPHHLKTCEFTKFTCNMCEHTTDEFQYEEHLVKRHSNKSLKFDIINPIQEVNTNKPENTDKIVIATYKTTKLMFFTKIEGENILCWIGIRPNKYNPDGDLQYELNITYNGKSFKYEGQYIQLQSLGDQDTPHVIIPSEHWKNGLLQLTLNKFEKTPKTDECPICMYAVTGTIRQCENGHLVYMNSASEIELCPICKMTMNSAKLDLSNIFPNLQNKCQYGNIGCLEVGTKADIDKHSMICEYRTIACPECKDEMVFHAFLNHAYCSHFYEFEFGVAHVFTFNESDKSRNYHFCNGHIFRLEVTKSKEESNVSFSFRVKFVNCNDPVLVSRFGFRIKFLDHNTSIWTDFNRGVSQIESEDGTGIELTQQQLQYITINYARFKSIVAQWEVYPIRI